jgi:hypothetical protein
MNGIRHEVAELSGRMKNIVTSTWYPKMKSSKRISNFAIRISYAFGLLLAVSGIVTFGWLQAHAQSQTQYLIYYDFWRNFTALKSANSMYPFIFHNVHTYATASLIWYLDVLFSHGNLYLIHLYVKVATLTIFGCLILLMRGSAAENSAPASWTIPSLLCVAALWLSPSNGDSFAYPVLDVNSATILLLLCLAAITSSRIRFIKQEAGHIKPVVIYALVVIIGFFTWETLLVVPFVIAVDALIKRDWKYFALQLGLIICCAVLYLFAIEKLPFTQIPLAFTQTPGERQTGATARNFLVLLSSHYGLLFRAWGITAHISGIMSMWCSAIQLVAFGLLVWQTYRLKARNRVLLFPIILATFGCVSIALAAWLREPTVPIDEPVSRYTFMSIIFSIAVLLQATIYLQVNIRSVVGLVGAAVIIANLSYVALGLGAVFLRGQTVSPVFIMARLEMAVFALSPGFERGLGPVEPDDGRGLRSDAHEFLRNHAWSVFSSDGYRAVGKSLSPAVVIRDGDCVRLGQSDLPREGADYLFVSFKGVDSDGVFLVTDRSMRIIGFSFAAQLSPLTRQAFALLPGRIDDGNKIYFARMKDGRPVRAARCL